MTRFKRSLLVTLAGMLAIVLVAAALGHALPTDDSAFIEATVFPWPQPGLPAPEPILLAEVKAKLEKGDRVLFLDARPREDYRAGHMIGAISLPVDEFERGYTTARDRLSEDVELIIYCNESGCDLGVRLSEALIEKGHVRVRVLVEGWQAWLAAGYPFEK